MRKAKICIDERLRYSREIDVLIPENITEGQLEKPFDECERYRADNTHDVVRFLSKHGIQLVGQIDDDMDSPDDMSIEITEYDFEKASESA